LVLAERFPLVGEGLHGGAHGEVLRPFDVAEVVGLVEEEGGTGS